MIVIATKRCWNCACDVPTSGFYADNAKLDGLQSKCIACHKRILRGWRSKNRPKIRAYKYGIEATLAGALLAVPLCQACGREFQNSGDERIDHCHDNSHVRGVVCNACNIAMAGPAEECIDRLRGCIAYLERDLERQSLEASCPG